MAKEYILREDVINDISELFTICRETLPNECGHHFIVEDELQIHLDHIRNLPEADVEEVRHGYWTNERWEGLSSFSAECSECTKRTLSYFHYNYCPNCGAKMDGDRE